MEAFSLLKYWRGNGGGGGGSSGVLSGADAVGTLSRTATSTTVFTTVEPHSSDSDSESDEGDDGPFFDLEFTAVEGNEKKEGEKQEEEEEDNETESELDESDNEDEEELKFTLSASSSDGVTDPNVSVSPSDDLFFNGGLVPVETSPFLLTASETNSKFHSSLVKSATKFRVLMLKLKKPKSNTATTTKTEKNDSECDGTQFVSATPKLQENEIEAEAQNRPQNKLFTVKLKFEEVSIMSLFSRDNSSKGKQQKQSTNEELANTANTVTDDKKLSKDVMQKYLKMVKPLYVRVSKRYSGIPSPPGKTEAVTDEPVAVAEKSQKQGNIPAKLRIVSKHLGKSKSASSAVVAAAPVVSNRRDDSLLQQQDAIQGAILHCKRSFNSSRGSESSILSRSASDASYEKSTSLTIDSTTLDVAKAVRD